MMSEAYCYVGCYPGAEVPEALHVLKCDTETGAIRDVQVVTGVEGTSYLQVDRAGRWLYSVLGDERKRETKGRAVRFALDGAKIGEMEMLAELPCPAPCHVELSPDERFVSFAAYRAGTAGTLPTDGGPVTSYVFPDDAMGPNAKRQEKAFAHQTFYVPSSLIPRPSSLLGVVDLGCDRIRFFDPETMRPTESPDLTFDPGDGPRHAIFSKDGKFLFVLCELSSCVYSFRCECPWGSGVSPLLDKDVASSVKSGGTPLPHADVSFPLFACVGKWSMLPADYDRWEPDGETLATKAAAIKLTADGKTLLASNRGHDSIAIFSVDAETGALTLRNIAKLGGRSPRDFELMPGDNYVIVGYELDDGIQSYRFDRKDFTLTPVGDVVKAWHPVCCKFVPS